MSVVTVVEFAGWEEKRDLKEELWILFTDCLDLFVTCQREIKNRGKQNALK